MKKIKTAFKDVLPTIKPMTPYDLELWNKRLSVIQKSISMGEHPITSVHRILASIKSTEEKLDFLSWFNIKTNSSVVGVNAEYEGFHMKKRAVAEDSENYSFYGWKPSSDKDVDTDIAEDSSLEADAVPEPYVNEQNAVDFEAARGKMVARTFAIDKLLEKYRKVLNHEQIENIEDALNNLRKKIRQLKIATTIGDSIIKTARILARNGFEPGGNLLVIAASERPMVKKAEFNQDDLGKIKTMIDSLADMSAVLRQRGLIRELATLDLDLYNMDIGSYFTELGDAQIKLMEGFNSAANKVDDLLARLRSQYNKQVKPHETPMSLNTKDFKEEDLPISKLFEKDDQAAKPDGPVEPVIPVAKIPEITPKPVVPKLPGAIR